MRNAQYIGNIVIYQSLW